MTSRSPSRPAPKPDSAIRWTRVFDADMATNDLDIELEVSSSADFTVYISIDGQQRLPVKALAKYDGCAKVKLAGISPGAVYYYRFTYSKGGKYYTTRVGKTKTAPSPDADVAVKFAFVSCQDYVGRYYNTYQRMMQEPIDFFVHLGDYIYETDGDPSFQNTTGRKVVFSDIAGAIPLLSADGKTTFHAAKSLSNYRELYRTYRSDAIMQAVHESIPMIATWDDHEFSNDCHGAVGTYFDGAKDETDVARRKNADQAWFEYMPADYLNSPTFAYDPAAMFPGDIKLWRDFVFGKHLHIVMTDLRGYRATNVIESGAFPGAVAVDQATLNKDFGGIPSVSSAYVPIDDAAWADYKTFITAVATAAGVAPAQVTGNISVNFINAAIAAAPAGSNPPAAIDIVKQSTLERGVAYIDAGKAGFFTSIGSRYFTIKPAYDIIARAAYNKSPANQDVFGSEQEAWFLQTLRPRRRRGRCGATSTCSCRSCST